ncbi:hypothetical protein ACFL4U_00360 [Candidatus Neomarinimicrobiota bacterium]
MNGRTLIRVIFLTGTMLWLWGCIPATWHQDDPYFAGYHRSDSSPGVTTPIVDRELIRRAIIPRPSREPVSRPSEVPAEDTYSEYTYQDWYRDRQQADTDIYINLSYHLGGPYYYHDFQDRYWREYMRRYHRLPWYANGWWFDDLWWDHNSWNPHYNRHYGWHDPWYSYYDPWYGGYDPWYGSYYDPFWSYSRQGYYRNSFYSDYGWGRHRGYYSGGYRGDSDTQKTTTARTRNRNDLPTSMPSNLQSGGGMTTSVRSGAASSGSSGTSSGSTARSTVRKGSSSASSSSGKSSSSGSRASKSSSSSSKKSSKSKTSRTRNRKP